MKFTLTQGKNNRWDGYVADSPTAVLYRDPEYKFKAKIWSAQSRQRLKLEVFSWYGGLCVCCGESQIDFLTLDHVYDDGCKELKISSRGGAIGTGIKRATGHNAYRIIRMAGYENRPLDRQILCFNCQWGKRLNDGFCPHNPEVNLKSVIRTAARE